MFYDFYVRKNIVMCDLVKFFSIYIYFQNIDFIIIFTCMKLEILIDSSGLTIVPREVCQVLFNKGSNKWVKKYPSKSLEVTLPKILCKTHVAI